MNPVQSVFVYMILTMLGAVFVFWLLGWWGIDTVSTDEFIIPEPNAASEDNNQPFLQTPIRTDEFAWAHRKENGIAKLFDYGANYRHES